MKETLNFMHCSYYFIFCQSELSENWPKFLPSSVQFPKDGSSRNAKKIFKKFFNKIVINPLVSL